LPPPPTNISSSSTETQNLCFYYESRLCLPVPGECTSGGIPVLACPEITSSSSSNGVSSSSSYGVSSSSSNGISSSSSNGISSSSSSVNIILCDYGYPTTGAENGCFEVENACGPDGRETLSCNNRRTDLEYCDYGPRGSSGGGCYRMPTNDNCEYGSLVTRCPVGSL
jgi:hypothetical protein